MFVELVEDELFDVVAFGAARALVDAPGVDGALKGCFAAGYAVGLLQVRAEVREGVPGGVERY